MRRGTASLAALALLVPAPACAEDDDDGVDLAAEVIVDLATVAAGDGDRKLRALTNVNVTGDFDLDTLVGWRGAKVHLDVLDNRGARPNDSAATLQGVNNIEVPKAGLRLFEAWIEQDLRGGASLKLGLYDVNSEFYANDSAGLLIAPPFGIGSELAATGPNGPSIFPSSALSARLNVPFADGAGYVRVAGVNARASTIGDSGGVDFSFRDGLLAIAEAGWDRNGWKLSVGGWRYTKNPQNIYETGPGGEPLRRVSQGAYAVIEHNLMPEGAARQVTAFLRAGLSDPHTTPYTGGFQAGVLVAPALAGRKDSQFSLGVNHAWISTHFRDEVVASGGRPVHGESMVEVTYSDALADWFSIQPDILWVRDPGGDKGARNVVVGTVRVTFSF
ncbi:carbohydrate porin [Novosphingobium cyanobacteriorum]|uniref:Carbohydrate porin n=1 Tax=Novosphingobium cyanobacteriorum TaxID=3024215 RepID=A0ABT6CK04_9SPHN|nr:carbohydrate porin [Novosphingobium cyanobacteriorum]MDF8334226.1 carbohydrate porin [Novosphingobium cyanobacteriorum]